MKLEVDILVVGGGPAGLATAAEAARQGASVLLVERERSIGRPVHTSGATSVDVMREFKVPSDLYHIVRNLRIVGPTASATFRFDGDIACVIDVAGVYGYLAAEAERAGARIVTGVLARALLENGRVVGARLRGRIAQDVKTKVLIDATGYRATLSREAGIHPGFRRFGVGAEYELEVPHYNQDESVVVVGSRFAPRGYAWAFPWGRGRARVGVGLIHADARAAPSSCLASFLAESRSLDIDLRDSRLVEEHRGLIPSDGLAATFVGDGIMAVGDAAGQPSLVAGEGIRISLEAAKGAGRVAAAAARDGNTSREALLTYERWFRREYGVELRVSRYINGCLASWSDDEWDRKVKLLAGVNGNDLAALLQGRLGVRHALRWLRHYPNYWRRNPMYGLSVAAHLLFKAWLAPASSSKNYKP